MAADYAAPPERIFVRLSLWLGLLAGPWLGILALFTPESGYGTLAGGAIAVSLVAYRQLRLHRPRPGTIAVMAAAIMALHLPFFPEADAVAQAIPFGVATIGAVASPFVQRRFFPWYVAYMGAIYMTQLYWTPTRTNTVLSLMFEVTLFTLMSVALRFVAGASAKSNLRYRHLFERVPTSIWLEDYSEVGEIMDRWRHLGVTDLPEFLEEHPEDFDEAIKLIQVKDVNPATVRLVGAKTRQDMLGPLDPRTIIAETKPSFVAVLDAIYNDNDSVRTDVVGAKIDGKGLEGVLRMMAPRDSVGRLNLAEVVVSITDVTDLKRAHRLLGEAKDRAESATAIKSQFLANMSHEIRTPMNAILGMTELSLATDLTSEQREYLGITKSSVDALLKLVNDILDFSKIEAGRLELDSVSFSLRDTVEDTVRALGIRATDKNIALSFEIDPSTPDGLRGDPGRLRQILINLVGNALKFTHVGGVAVTVAPQQLEDESAVLHFAVADTGIGIPEDDQASIFETFAQGDASSTRRYGGTGLGLPISAQLVEMMDGEMGVDSSVGAGSTFHFTARFGLVTDDATVTSGGDTGRTTVMTIGQSIGGQSVVEMVRQAGMDALTAGSAPDALEIIAALPDGSGPDVIVVEVDSEFDVPSRLIDLGVPIVVVAEPGRRGDAARYREMGAAGYLTKPVAQTDLVDGVRTAATGSAGGALITRHWLRSHRIRYEILLADDSPTNRMLAIRLLENRGHRVTGVEDGQRAVEAHDAGSFDVILMDVQMPVMDGLEATQAIRKAEADAHIPIIALTAHALDADRQRCLDAGMDAYVSKPFRPAELLATIEQVASGGFTESQIIDEVDYDDLGPAIDRRELMELVGGIPDLLAEILKLVLAEIPGLAADIPQAIAEGDLVTVGKRAHRIKGSVGSIAAKRSFDKAAALDQAARDGDTEAVSLLWSELEQELKFLYSEAESLLAERVS